jgi:WD40 repeat protein
VKLFRDSPSGKVLLCATGIGAIVGAAAALGLRAYSSGKNSAPEESGPRTVKSLRGILYLEKSRRLAIYWGKGDFELWDTENGSRLGPVTRLPRPVGWCFASPDESTILTADRWVDPFDAADQKLTGKRFVPSLALWDAKTGAQKRLIPVPEAAGYPFFDRWRPLWLEDSSLLLVRSWSDNWSRGPYDVWFLRLDLTTGKVTGITEYFQGIGDQVLLSPNRKLAVVNRGDCVRRTKGGSITVHYLNKRTNVFDLERLSVVSSWEEPPYHPEGGDPGTALLARWCPDGRRVITVSNEWIEERNVPKVRLWDARSGKLIRTFLCHNDYILDVAFTADGERFLTASEDQTVRVWSLRTGKTEAILSGHSAGLNKVVVLPGDTLAVSAAEESVAKVWELTTGKLAFDLPDHDSAVRDVEIVSAEVVRTITRDGTATTWNCATGKRLNVIPRLSEFPKRFGVCELAEIEGTLHMRVMDKDGSAKN